MAPSQMRIGELSRRVGVTTDVLRAWERRYGVLRPDRTAGGFRLYGPADADRVRRMLELLEEGMAAAEAAAAVLAGEAPAARPTVEEMIRAVETFDEAGLQDALDDLLVSDGREAALVEVVLPWMHAVGERWEHGDLSVGHEHFASQVLEGRLLSEARGWDAGRGRRAVLACPGGERHSIGCLCFGLVLRGRGWRITWLGGDAPVETIRDACRERRPAVAVLAATVPGPFVAGARAIRALARELPVAVAGAGADAALARRLGATLLDARLTAAADRLAAATA